MTAFGFGDGQWHFWRSFVFFFDNLERAFVEKKGEMEGGESLGTSIDTLLIQIDFSEGTEAEMKPLQVVVTFGRL